MSTSTSSVSNLDSTFLSLINNLMMIERQPLTRLEEKKDSITVQQATYTKMDTLLKDFQSSVKALLSTDENYEFDAGHIVSVTDVADDETVLKASASSSAIAADYEVSVTTLAKEHRVSSNKQTYSNQSLNYSGSFLLSGNGTASTTLTSGIANIMSAVTLSDVDTDESEIGTGTYFVETRNDSKNGWQFRLVNSEGDAVKIKKNEDSYTSGWQSIPTTATEFDTGRGITLSLGGDASLFTTASRGSGAAEIQYQAKGTEISVEANDTLVDIAYAINHAEYAENDEVVATIMDNQLILSRELSGADRFVTVKDGETGILTDMGILKEDGTFNYVKQTPCNAKFSVNGMEVIRSENKNLTDVIQGVTLNLASDAEGKNATISVEYDPKDQKDALSNFITKYNNLMSYLSDQIETEKQEDGTYKRGSLAGDSMFQSLRSQLLQLVSGSVANDGEYNSLSDLGITMDDKLALSISNSSDLTEALTDKSADVTELLDGIMLKLKTKIARFIGTDGYITTTSNSLDTQLNYMTNQIENIENRLSVKEESLYSQYGSIQARIEEMSYTMSTMKSLYG